MKNFKDLNRWSTILIILTVTFLIAHYWKQRNVDRTLQGGDIQHAIDTQQYDK